MKNLLRNLLKYTVGLPFLVIFSGLVILFYLGYLIPYLIWFICGGGWDTDFNETLLEPIFICFKLWRPIR